MLFLLLPWCIDELSLLCLRLFVAGWGSRWVSPKFMVHWRYRCSHKFQSDWRQKFTFHNKILSVVATILCINISRPDHYCCEHRPLQLPLLCLLPSLPLGQMPQAKWNCLKIPNQQILNILFGLVRGTKFVRFMHIFVSDFRTKDLTV